MILPYLDRVSVGLSLGAETATLVALRRRFGRVRLLRVKTVALGDNPGPALQALVEASPIPFVDVAVPDALVACEIVPVPDFDDAEDRQAWAEAEAARRVPSSVARDAVLVVAEVFEAPPIENDTHLNGLGAYAGAFGGTQSSTEVSVARAPRARASLAGASLSQEFSAFEPTAYLAALCVFDGARLGTTFGDMAASGLTVERLGTGLLELASLELVSMPQRGILLSQTAGPVATRQEGAPDQEGVPNRKPARVPGQEVPAGEVSVRSGEGGELAVSGSYGEARLSATLGRPTATTFKNDRHGGGDVAVLFPGDYTSAKEPSAASEPPTGAREGRTTREGDLLDPLSEVLGPGTLPPQAALAAALAYERLYLGLVLVQALPAPHDTRASMARSAHEGKRATLAVALLLLAVLLVLMGAELLVAAGTTRTAERVQAQAPALVALDRERAVTAQLEADLAAARTLNADRTMFAYVLEHLARAVPPDVTLTEVRLGSPGQTSSQTRTLGRAEPSASSVHTPFRGEGTDFSPDTDRGKEGVKALHAYAISGIAVSNSAVASYARNIERLDFVATSSVLSVERLSPRALRRMQRDPGQNRVSFEIEGRIAPPTRTYGSKAP